MASLRPLVVEDDLASLELMTEVFTSLKAVVRAISDSAKAADVMNQEKFDGIFLDLEMPKISGFDLAQRIRQSSWNKSAPIVIVTGRDDRRTMQEIFAVGATFYLHKPVDRQKLSGLFRTVRAALLENRRRYQICLGVVLDGLAHLEPIHVGHHHVQKHQVDLSFRELRNRRGAIWNSYDRVPMAREEFFQ